MKRMSDPFALWSAAALCLALSSGGTALQAGTGEQETNTSSNATKPATTMSTDRPTEYNKATCLIGLRAQNPDGKDLGKIRDIVIDFPSGTVSYAVLGTSSGFLGLSEKYLAVPLQAFTTGSKTECLVLNTEPQSVKQAQGFDRDHWPALGAPAWGAEPFWKTRDSQIHEPTIKPQSMDTDRPTTDVLKKEGEMEEHVDEPVVSEDKDKKIAIDYDAEKGRNVTTTATNEIKPTLPTTTTSATHEPGKCNRVRSLLGMRVRNQQDEDLGTIRDLVIDLAAERVSYAVLGVNGTATTPAKVLAVPLSAFRASADQDHLLLNAEKKNVESAQGFSPSEWPSVSSPSWGAQPFWKDASEIQVAPSTKSMEKKSAEPPSPPTDW